MNTGRWSWLKGLTLTVASTAAALAAAELVVRAAGVAPDVYVVQDGRYRLSDNPRLGYEPVPGFRSVNAGAMLDFRGTANSLGFRDREHAVAKPEGIRRIIVLGDSITQGMGIPDPDDIFTAVMERRLRAAGRRVEVLNFGVNGYNTLQEAEILRQRGLAYEPDLVVLAYCVNDGYYDSGGIHRTLLREAAGREPLMELPEVLLESALFRLGWALTRRRGEPAGPGSEAVVEEGLVAAGLGLLARAAQEAGFEVLVALFPMVREPGTAPDPAAFDAVRALAERHGFDQVALDHCRFDGAFPGDLLHPDERGHGCAGRTIAAHLLEKGVGDK